MKNRTKCPHNAECGPHTRYYTSEWTRTMATSGIVIPLTEEELTSGAFGVWSRCSSDAKELDALPAEISAVDCDKRWSPPRDDGWTLPEIIEMEGGWGPPDEVPGTTSPPSWGFWRYNTPPLALSMRGTLNSPSLPSSKPSYSSKSSSDFLIGSLCRLECDTEWWDWLSEREDDPWWL